MVYTALTATGTVLYLPRGVRLKEREGEQREGDRKEEGRARSEERHRVPVQSSVAGPRKKNSVKSEITEF
jgi:hypothetical protein